jgi:hypothetical protein
MPGLLVIVMPFIEFFGPVTPLDQLRQFASMGQGFWFAETLPWLALPCALLLINVGWLLRSLLKKQPFRVAAERFLVLGYLPNATHALLAFYEALSSGAAMAAIACACYLAMALLLSADRTPGRADTGVRA